MAEKGKRTRSKVTKTTRKDRQRSSKPIPAINPENRVQQIAGLALDRMEERIISGKATGAELVYMAKIADPERQLRMQKLEAETKMAYAKKRNLEFDERQEELYKEAIDAMRHYQGGYNADI